MGMGASYRLLKLQDETSIGPCSLLGSPLGVWRSPLLLTLLNRSKLVTIMYANVRKCVGNIISVTILYRLLTGDKKARETMEFGASSAAGTCLNRPDV